LLCCRYTAQYGCSLYEAPTCTNNHAYGFSAVLFFGVFHILGGLVFLNLFIGVITVGMADAMEAADKEQWVLDHVEELKSKGKMRSDSIHW
jgi:hypothetical protein